MHSMHSNECKAIECKADGHRMQRMQSHRMQRHRMHSNECKAIECIGNYKSLLQKSPIKETVSNAKLFNYKSLLQKSPIKETVSNAKLFSNKSLF